MLLQITLKRALLITLITLFPSAGCADGGKGPRPAPPPEAVQACAEKNVGDAVEFTGRRGERLEATCQEIDGQLAAIPIDGRQKVS